MKNVTIFLVCMFFLVYIVWDKEEKTTSSFEQVEETLGTTVDSQESQSQFELREVVDGDTIRMYSALDKKVKAYRFVGIDTPENTALRYGYVEQYGNQAKQYLQELLAGKNLSIEYDEIQGRQDTYERELVFLFADAINVWEQMILAWYAKEYTYNKKYKYQELYRKAQSQAQEQNLWIWSLDEKTNESVFNTQNADLSLISALWTNANQKFVDQKVATWECIIKWNINSDWVKIYHYDWCKSYTKTKISPERWERYFCNEAEALAAGWRVAGNC